MGMGLPRGLAQGRDTEGLGPWAGRGFPPRSWAAVPAVTGNDHWLEQMRCVHIWTVFSLLQEIKEVKSGSGD